MKAYLNILFVCFLAQGFKAQTVEVVFFHAVPYGEHVFLSWEIAAGSTCNGINIQRARVNQEFETIGQIEGLCGSPNTSKKYDYLDQNPLYNQKSRYRLEFGGNGLSDTVAVEVNYLRGESYILKGNPLESNSSLLFQNDNHTTVVLSIYDQEGRLVVIKSTNSDQFNLSKESYEVGSYHFTLKSELGTQVIHGSFVVN